MNGERDLLDLIIRDGGDGEREDGGGEWDDDGSNEGATSQEWKANRTADLAVAQGGAAGDGFPRWEIAEKEEEKFSILQGTKEMGSKEEVD